MPIANNTVNAVALVTLPDAPVDAVTGLQVPTIAVATAGGVSLIQNNGIVLTGTASGGPNTFSIDITEDLLTVSSSNTAAWYYISKPGKLTANFTFSSIAHSSAFPWFNTGSNSSARRWKNSAAKFDASRVGLLRHNAATVGKGVGTVVSNTFNTGHLIGDIRRAYLADVDVGSVSGTELVTNGTFDTDTTGWTVGTNLAAAVVSGQVQVTRNGGIIATAAFKQVVTVIPGKTYLIRIDVVTNNGASRNITAATNTAFPNASAASFVGTGTFSFVVTATDSQIQINLWTNDASTSTFDNISLKEVVADRSYKAQAASITGSLAKSTVAAAAQLVAYSGFSAANYLREPYSADLDFGTGEFTASAWLNVPVTLPVANFPVVGSELQVDSGFTNGDLSAWTQILGSGGFSVVSGDLYANPTVGEIRLAPITPVSLVLGKWYRLSCTARRVNGRVRLYVGNGNSTDYTFGAIDYYGTTNETKYIYIQGTGGLLYTKPVVENGSSGYFDEISVTEVTPAFIADRSFSSGPKLNLGLTGNGLLTATASDGTTTRTVTTTAAYNTATWIKPEAVYTTDGTLAIRVNGTEVAATRGTPLLTLTNTSAVLTIGNSYALDAPFPGSIALLKMSATAPTAEQGQWMYEQEKQMFRDGAQVCLPDSGSIVDLTYDDATDKWIAVSAANESEWSGLVRTSVTASPAGSYTKVFAASGIQLHARSTTNPGVDITIPSYGLREELVNRAEKAAKLARNLVALDYVGGFTATTVTGATSITSVASLTYPVSYVGARISGAGIPANTTVVAVSGTTIYMSAAATATASGVQISFVDFNLPLGYEAKNVLSAGATKVEGSTKDFTRLFDGFKETIRFGTAPGFNVAVQIQATRSVQ